MAYLMGIDLGTSSLKTLLMNEKGEALAVSARAYQYDSPISGYAEQNPEVWWNACVETVREVLSQSGISGDAVTGVSFSGQMHGAVLLDKNGEVIRPVILHCDVRSSKQVEELKAALGNDRVRDLMLNPVYTGFLLVSLLWVRDNEPENFARIHKVCLPKDYIKFKISGEVSSDFSDASATLAFDIPNNCWSDEILKAVQLPKEIFPDCYETYAPVGHVCPAAARETGLSEKTEVVCGGGDQVMQAIGNGVIEPGQATSNLGSSGQISFQSDRAVINPALSTNTFCSYKKDQWVVMGAIMYAGLSLEWFGNMLHERDFKQLDVEAKAAGVGAGGLIFLPYLNGERTPHANPDLSAMFLGINSLTGRGEMARAVMEGVGFALYQCMEICETLGLKAETIVASGGGAKSPLWLQIQSDIYGLPVKVTDTKEQACLGAAIIAGVGTGVFKDVQEACAGIIRHKDKIVVPSKENHARYQEYYALFKDTYQANKSLLERITRMR